MRIGLTQMDIVWEDKTANRKRVCELVAQAAKNDVEVLVFPEMTLTGFTMNTELAGEKLSISETLKFFKDISVGYNMAIVFGMVEDSGKGYYNKLMVVSEGCVIYEYDKIHPFNYGEEGKHYIGGRKVKNAELKGFGFSGFVCYDLRFPEIFQAVADESDIIYVIANWPKERVLHWESLLRARAIENQCFVVGVNRIGRGNNIEYVESSAAFDPLGERLTKIHDESELMVVDVDKDYVKDVRRKYPFRQDRNTEFYETLYHINV